jgi:transposase-like protein
LSDQERARIAELHGEGLGCSEIARRIGRDPSTVSRAAKKLGLSFAREATKAATEAHQADIAAERAQLARDLLGDAQRLRERAWSEYKVVTSGPQGAEITVLELPPLGDVRNAYASLGICVDKVKVITDADRDPVGMSAVDAWLRGITGG